VSPRIGITRAAELEGRYFVRDNPYVSRTPAGFAIQPYKAERRRARRTREQRE
jgi:hypothetical protein